jgi:hypothetical protein
LQLASRIYRKLETRFLEETWFLLLFSSVFLMMELFIPIISFDTTPYAPTTPCPLPLIQPPCPPLVRGKGGRGVVIKGD